MQATGYVLGYDTPDGVEYSDSPPCTSEEIMAFMIRLNDETSERKRAKLKRVIPDIINTAPIKLKIVSYKKEPILIEFIRACYDKDYTVAESIRSEMITQFEDSLPKKKFRGTLEPSDACDAPMTKLLPFIKELANVKKFDSSNKETTPDVVAA
jgi:hypothetical protein